MARQQANTGDEWQSLPVQSKGGLVLNLDALTQGTTQPGSAKILQNFEPALEGGYRRINGYAKFDTNTVPGDANSAVLGVKAALGGVFAARRVSATPTTDIYFSTGSGWGSRINSANRGGNPNKVRFTTYALSKPVIIGCDGTNPAFKYDGTTYTLINGTGAPADPKYAELFNSSLVLAGYSSNKSAVSISAPNADTTFDGTMGAVEIQVGDVVTGIKVFRDILYIFCLNGIFKVAGESAADYQMTEVTRQIGCLNGDTIQEVGGDLIYLAPDGFRSVAGTYNIGDVDLSLQSRAIQPFLRDNVIGNSITQFSSVVIRKKSQYRCMFYVSGASKSGSLGVIGKIEQGNPTDAYNYIYTTYEWSTTVGIQPYCADSYYDSGIERVVIGDPSTGFVYSLETGNDFDGTAIQAVYQSPYITFNDVSLRKVMQKIDVFTEAEGAATINLGLNFDFNAMGILQPASQALNLSGSFPVYGGAVYGTDVYASISFPVFKKNLLGSGFTTAFSYTSNGGAPYRIDSYQIIYSLKGRR